MKAKIQKQEIEKNPDLAIQITGFCKKFKSKYAVNNMEMEVNKGTIHGFIGPNGSGKTTTIKSLIGAMVPTNGHLFINGFDSNSIDAKKDIGYIPENARFPKHLNTYRYLIEMGYLRGLSMKNAKQKASKILKNFNLEDKKRQNPNNFSSGQKKKILLAQALLTNPSVLILDEPAANLDPDARNQLFADLKRLRDAGKTILISSHILAELQGLVDEITILNFGKVIFKGKVVNEKDNYYELTVADPLTLPKLVEIVSSLGYDIKEQSNNSLILHLPNRDKDITNITSQALEAKIMLTNIGPFVTDIPKLYKEVVSKANQGNYAKDSALIN